MKFQRVWFFGGTNRDTTIDDYVIQYVAENGRVINVEYGFTNMSKRIYVVDGEWFDTLAEAKAYVIGGAGK